MKNVTLSLISLALISACEVSAPSITETATPEKPDTAARTMAPEVEALPTTDPFEAFLMPSSFNPTINTASTERSASDDLSLIKLYIREGGAVSPYSNRDWTIYNAFIESSDGSQIERANVMVGVGNGWSTTLVCTNYQSDDISEPCSMLIRDMKWVNSNTASYEMCQTDGRGFVAEETCVTKYSNE